METVNEGGGREGILGFLTKAKIPINISQKISMFP
jgi:hypothetical protein